MTNTTHLASEREEAGYLQRTNVRVHYRCGDCGYEWSVIFKSTPKKDPPCPMPACEEVRKAEAELRAAERMEQILESRIPPGHIGDKPVVKAVDETARIVMEDYGLTNLRDNIREGDMAAPKLPTQHREPVTGRTVNLQAQADGYFSTKAFAAEAGVDNRRAELLKRRAVAGAYRNMSVNPNVSAFGRKSGEGALQVLRTEEIGSKPR